MVETADVKKTISDAEKKMEKTVEATRKEFKNIRTGRASIGLVEGITVDYYNTPTPLKNLASISTPDARTIQIQPWDATALSDIERALLKSDLGLTPINDGKIIRMNLPTLTSERREELTKVIRKTAEEGRVAIRSARHDAIEAVKKMEKEKSLPEDASHLAQKDAQKLTDKYIALIDEALKQKETEIHQI